MINVRNYVFETNSSSAHSIVINHNNAVPDGYFDIPLKNGIYSISNGLEFGRAPFKMLATVDTKTRFVIASLANSYIDGPDAFIIKLTNIFRKHYLALQELRVAGYQYNHTLYYGDIDHQSLGLLKRFLEKKNITFEDFIFDPKYIVVIDGDEYCEFQSLYDLKIINTDEIEVFGGMFNE